MACQRVHSLMTAHTYGSASRSSKSGMRCGPTTVSSSVRAFSCTSGKEARTRKNAWMIESVYLSSQCLATACGDVLTVSAPPSVKRMHELSCGLT